MGDKDFIFWIFNFIILYLNLCYFKIYEMLFLLIVGRIVFDVNINVKFKVKVVSNV